MPTRMRRLQFSTIGGLVLLVVLSTHAFTAFCSRQIYIGNGYQRLSQEAATPHQSSSIGLKVHNGLAFPVLITRVTARAYSVVSSGEEQRGRLASLDTAIDASNDTIYVAGEPEGLLRAHVGDLEDTPYAVNSQSDVVLYIFFPADTPTSRTVYRQIDVHYSVFGLSMTKRVVYPEEYAVNFSGD